MKPKNILLAIIIGITLLSSAGFFIFNKFMNRLVASPDNLPGLLGKMPGQLTGLQPAQWQSGLFTPDGKYYVYTYRIQNIMQYSRRGGSTFRSGPVTYYLQVMDATNGTPLLSKPFKTKNAINIMDIQGNQVWLSDYNSDGKWTAPALYIIGDQQLKFTTEDLSHINKNIQLQEKNNQIRFYINTTGQPGAVVEVADGRQYLIDGSMGRFTLTTPVDEYLSTKDETNLQVVSRIADYEFQGNSRTRIVRKDTPTIISGADFLQPTFLVTGKQIGMDIRNTPTEAIYKNYFFVLSSKTKANSKDKLLSMLDRQNLQTIWQLELPQQDQDMDQYDCERFALVQNRLLFANKTHLFIIDMDTGKIRQTKLLY